MNCREGGQTAKQNQKSVHVCVCARVCMQRIIMMGEHRRRKHPKCNLITHDNPTPLPSSIHHQKTSAHARFPPSSHTPLPSPPPSHPPSFPPQLPAPPSPQHCWCRSPFRLGLHSPPLLQDRNTPIISTPHVLPGNKQETQATQYQCAFAYLSAVTLPPCISASSSHGLSVLRLREAVLLARRSLFRAGCFCWDCCSCCCCACC